MVTEVIYDNHYPIRYLDYICILMSQFCDIKPWHDAGAFL